MSALIAKLILCPLAILVTYFIFPGDIHFANIYQILGLGFFIAVMGYYLEVLLLRPGRYWVTNFADILASFIFIYMSQFIFAGVSVTVMGAVLTSALLFITEYLQHLFLLRNRWTQKRT